MKLSLFSLLGGQAGRLNGFKHTNFTFAILVCLLEESWRKAQKYSENTMPIQQTWEIECCSLVETRKENNYGKNVQHMRNGSEKTEKLYSRILSKFRLDVEDSLLCFRQRRMIENMAHENKPIFWFWQNISLRIPSQFFRPLKVDIFSSLRVLLSTKLWWFFSLSSIARTFFHHEVSLKFNTTRSA